MSSKVINLSPGTRCLKNLFTKIRDRNTNKLDFRRYANRLMTVICEEGLATVNHTETVVTTPTGLEYVGESIDLDNMVVVSIIRAADSMLDVFLSIAPEAAVGKILIQRNEETKIPTLYYSKLPQLPGKEIVLLDPMLATGGSAAAAVRVLLDNGAEEDKIIFFNVVSCPQGIECLTSAFPKMRIVTGEIDDGLNEKAYIIPGLGDYGDRYYGTA